MTSIQGVEIYPIISLGIFVLFFVVMLFWVFTYDKERIAELSDYPLNDNNPS